MPLLTASIKPASRDKTTYCTYLPDNPPAIGQTTKEWQTNPAPADHPPTNSQKHHLTFTPRKLSKALKRQMPAWFHIRVPPNLYHKMKIEYLQQRHKTVYIKDLKRVCGRLNNANSRHLPNQSCLCRQCRQDRAWGCTNPHKCAQHAKDITGLSDELYNMYKHPKKDGLTLTHHQKEKNQRAVIANGEEITFDPTITARGSLDECF